MWGWRWGKVGVGVGCRWVRGVWGWRWGKVGVGVGWGGGG